MGKVTGFLDYKRQTAPARPVKERLKDYKEVFLPLPEKEVSTQGARCMDCGIPFCHTSGCSLGNLIPEWNDAAYKGQWDEAYERLDLTNNLPEITGRVCPAPCEPACTLAINTNPVSIKQIELSVIEKAFQDGLVVPKPPKKEKGKKVAVIGSGPAGLGAGQQLRRMGYDVTVFEKDEKIGGLLRYGIPDFKLEKHIIDRRLKQMEAEGLKFKTGVNIGTDMDVKTLRNDFDAVLLAMGAGAPRNLPIPGRELDGVCFAMEYLTQSNKFVDGLLKENEIVFAKNKVVLVIGGGDTGSDCVGTANRQGAKEVHQFEILTKPEEWKEPWNPDWPHWPKILRTSSSQEEGCLRQWEITTNSLSGKDGKVTEGHFSKVEWEFPAGARPVMKKVEGSDFTMKVDLVLLAMGFIHVEHSPLIKDLGVTLDERGNISVDKNHMTSSEGVFAAGDSHTGATLVLRAIDHGWKAAKAIDLFLSQSAKLQSKAKTASVS